MTIFHRTHNTRSVFESYKFANKKEFEGYVTEPHKAIYSKTGSITTIFEHLSPREKLQCHQFDRFL